MEQTLSEIIALELFFGFLAVCFFGVLCFFVCRLLLAVAKWFEVKRRLLEHEFAVKNYRDDD